MTKLALIMLQWTATTLRLFFLISRNSCCSIHSNHSSRQESVQNSLQTSKEKNCYPKPHFTFYFYVWSLFGFVFFPIVINNWPTEISHIISTTAVSFVHFQYLNFRFLCYRGSLHDSLVYVNTEESHRKRKS